MMKRILNLILVLLATAALGAQELPLLSTDAPIGPRDILKVTVVEDPSINAQVTVSPDGNIVLNVVERVQVSGLTATQIEARLKSILEANYLAKATVLVEVVEFASKPISVVGAVVRPGAIRATGSTTLIQAITQAGGLAAGHGRELYILRTGANGLTEQVSVPVDELMVQGNPDYNIPLSPNDLVNVPVDTPVTIYVMGEVMRPGKSQFRSSQTPTLLQALADAGGPTDRAGKKAIVMRTTGGKQVRMVINFHDITKGRRKDEILQDNDTVLLEESLF